MFNPNKFAKIFRMLSVILLLLIFAKCNAEIDKSSAQPVQSNIEISRMLRKSVTFAYTCGIEFLNLIRTSKHSSDVVIKYKKLMEENRILSLFEIVKLLMPYVGYACMILLGLIFVIFVPIVGFCFCLCRCGGKCGGRIRGMDPKRARCKRSCYSTFLALISIVMLGGLVLAFINNQLIHDSLTHPALEINVVKQVIVANEQAGNAIDNMTNQLNKAEKINNRDLDDQKKNVDERDMETDGINKFFRKLSTDVNDKIQAKSHLSDISYKLKSALDFLKKNYKPNDKLEEMRRTLIEQSSSLLFENVQPDLQQVLKKYLPKQIQELKTEIKKTIDDKDLYKQLKNIMRAFKDIHGYFKVGLQHFQRYIQLDYLDYRLYAFIGLCCFLLLIELFYLLGLAFGLLGERPFEDARICNRGVGANLLMAGVAFAFLITPTIMIVEMGLFFPTAAVQTEICRYATNQYPPGTRELDRLVQFQNDASLVNPVSAILVECGSNSTSTSSFISAFNITKQHAGSYSIDTAINRVVKTLEKQCSLSDKQKIYRRYLISVSPVLSNITKEIYNSKNKYDGFDQDTKSKINEKFQIVLDSIEQFHKLESDFIGYFNQSIYVFRVALERDILLLYDTVITRNYQPINCRDFGNSSNKIVNAGCITLLQPIMGYWIGVGICLVLTVPALIFAVKLAGLYRCTEKYSSDYEEPDYNSYMGFYTNNADNIPMKRPKSSKSNSKGNNKDVKQNNPQYLPVYSYDAYE